MQTSHPEDEYSLIGFSGQAQVLLERTHDAEALLRGQTALYDAIALGLEQVRQSRYAKRALLVISDGADNQSRLSLNELRRLSQEAGVTLHAIVIGDYFSFRQGGVALGELARASGGSPHIPLMPKR